MKKNIIAISNDLYIRTNIFNKSNTIYIKKNEDLNYENIKSIDPEYIFFPHWSYIIPAEIYQNFKCIIFHMTDLPFGRGGSPLQNLIVKKIYKTKISAIMCEEEIDSGDIYIKRDFDISYGNASEIYLSAGHIIAEMIDEIIQDKLIPYKQDGEVVKFNRRKPYESNLEDILDLKTVYDYIRMLDADGYPSAFLENEKLKYEFINVKEEDDYLIANVKIKLK